MTPRSAPLPRALLVLLLPALLLTFSTACKDKDATPDPEKLAGLERAGLEHYSQRRTLERMGDPISEIFPAGPLIASRDQVYLLGPDEAPVLLAVQRPLAMGDRAMIFDGPKRRLDVELGSRERVLFSARGASMLVYQGLNPSEGEPWSPGTDVKLYAPGKTDPVVLPRQEGVALEALFDDGRVLMRDPGGRFRLYGPEGAPLASYTLPDFLETREGSGPRSKVDVLRSQGIIVLRDFDGPRDKKGNPFQSGLRLFNLSDGTLRAAHPQGMLAIAPRDPADRYFVLERGGALTRYDGGVAGASVQMPGAGELSISPSGDYIAVTSAADRLWLIEVASMRVLWEHTSPEPWNRFIDKGTSVSDGGRVFASRIHLSEHSAPKELQIFTIDAEGAGLVLLERPYLDALIPPVGIMGATDSGKTAMFGAMGEEIRVLELQTATGKSTPAKLPDAVQTIE